MKKLIPILAVALAVGGGAFYGGTQYAESKTGQGLRNLSPGERQQRLQGMGVNAGDIRGRFGGARGNGFVAGEIISKDEKSVTVKLSDGGSKIVFFGESTEIVKSVSGGAADLETGKTITVNGSTNQDGSVTAKSIQLRPLP